ncbi:MAG: hypothetical protein ACI84K_000916 [Pseudohongiellaceae bacterium]|jgi:uncharacterized protein YbjT (DUF2867 family)
MGKTAWVAGATGVVGSHLIALLNQNPAYSEVIALVRHRLPERWKKFSKVTQWPVNYQALKAASNSAHVDDLFCALGSTTKKTPDKQDYYQIDVQYPLNFAELGAQHGARYYGLVSSHGANPKSLSYYLKMKGELEDKLSKYSYPHISIARPGLLKGEREEFRLLEHLSGFFMNQMPGNYKAIKPIDVAAALIEAANNGNIGLERLPSKSMQNASKRYGV